jgi:RhtB (resistance to homoserine/threonine) family protein
MIYFQEFLTVAVVHLLAAMAPGPDFVMIVRNSLLYSRRTGIYSAVGLSLGIIVHITYCLMGIGLLISKSIVLFSTVKYIGAAYLIYIGYKSLRSKSPIVKLNDEIKPEAVELKGIDAIKQGFLTNVLNPKATLFFFALFTQVINPETPVLVQALYGFEMVVMQFAWFGFLALVMSHQAVKHKFAKIQTYAEKAIGAVLIVLGIKVALSSNK